MVERGLIVGISEIGGSIRVSSDLPFCAGIVNVCIESAGALFGGSGKPGLLNVLLGLSEVGLIGGEYISE